MKHRILVLALSLVALLTACRGNPSSGLRYFTVEGAVEISGEFAWYNDLTLWEAVMQAKPIAERCDLSRVRLCRQVDGEPLTLTIDVQHMTDTGDSTLNVRVREGDVILVPVKVE